MKYSLSLLESSNYAKEESLEPVYIDTIIVKTTKGVKEKKPCLKHLPQDKICGWYPVSGNITY